MTVQIGGTPAPSVDQALRWKGRWLSAQTGLYDVRARQWSPELGSFTSIDEFSFHDPKSTLWGVSYAAYAAGT